MTKLSLFDLPSSVPLRLQEDHDFKTKRVCSRIRDTGYCERQGHRRRSPQES